MKLSLGMIVRNEAKTLEKCLESVAPYVDEIIIGLAGKSDDDTPKIAKKYATKLIVIKWEDDFSAARNAVLQKATGDYFMWLDGDDELIGGAKLRGHVERHPEAGSFHMGYDYGQDENGVSLSFLVRERVVRRDLNWYWSGRIHEVMLTDEPHEVYYVPDVLVKHNASAGKVRGTRNLEYLYKDLEEQEPDPSQRLLFYLGREEMLKGDFEKAILHLQRFVARAEFGIESYYAVHTLADIYRIKGDMKKADQAELMAIQIQPDWPDAYFGLAESSFLLGNWKACIEWTKIGSTKEVPEHSFVINPRNYDYDPLLIAAIASSNIGDLEGSLEGLSNAYRISPSPSLEGQMRDTMKQIKANRILDQFLGVVEHLARHDEWLKVRQIFAAAPKVLETHPRVRELWGKTLRSTSHIDDPSVMVDFYKNNPDWTPMDDKLIFSEEWAQHPRVKYAIKVARDTRTNTIVDLGCSDGFISFPLWADGSYKIDGLDLDPRCVDLANKRSEEHGATDLVNFSTGSIEEVKEWADCENFAKYDLALLFETLEHVVSPAEVLESVEKVASHIAITTPFMAWEDGEVDWEKVEPKGHIRIFDLNDIEALLTPRGRISNLYREPWGKSAWIFADYEVGAPRAKKNISIVGGFGLEPWGPRKLREEGIGGSETAVIRLAEELSNHGSMVTVYNSIDHPGYYEYVRYRSFENFVPDVRSDMLIAWRSPELADLDINTGRLVLWMHDVDAGDRLTPERDAKFSDIVVLTEWHKEYFLKKYPFVDPDKVHIIGNGVDLSRFEEPVGRDSKRVIYASSPDRGLDVILEHIWPRVIEEVPDAELHYYYGWGNFKALASDPRVATFMRRFADLSLDAKNVFNHGRVTQDELAKEMMKGSIWLYPTYFYETYCITGVEAQAAGLLPIYNPIGALENTVKRGVPITGDVRDPQVAEKYIREVINALRVPPTDTERAQIQTAVPAQPWREVAEQWQKMVSH